MDKIQTLSIRKEIVLNLARFTVLIGTATIAPLFGQQAITGPIVNAVFFVSAVLLGPQNAILVGLLPSIIAISVGLLPLVLAPMIPFIMTGNAILILIFSYLRKRNYWLGVVFASISKFLFLFISSSFVINLLIKEELAQQVANIMRWPQLLTAVSGGLIAFIFLKSIKKI